MASFTKQQQRELRKRVNRLPLTEGCQGAEKFLLEYVGFESVYRKV
ncbi:hypothetical protein [Methyloprofundus sedimenti]|nr:hypothetical protein [Methyloprofundus sedimenti]